VGAFDGKSAWCSGEEGCVIIVVGIGSFNSKQSPSSIRCGKASTAMSKSGWTSLSVEVLGEEGWVTVGRAGGFCTGDAW